MEPQDFERECGFALDSYQREAIGVIHGGGSVLVAAPTGAGKTVVAEYALASCRAGGSKFFYTTPLKALSNQKFRDFSRSRPPGEVGLLTGDNSINGDAPLVVMTTEVLRNMIYEGSPLLEGLGAVVLDECHYLHDPYRGGVWEEIIIHLPGDVTLVALSATVSNAAELGEWMDSLRGDVSVVISDERPVELKNYYFAGRALVPLFAGNLMEVINEQLEILKKSEAARRGKRRGRRGARLAPRRVEVIRKLRQKDMLPAIYFLFSRAACSDSVAMWLEEGSGLNTRSESEAIERYLEEKFSPLDRADLDCLNYAEFRAALTAGVAAHHAGELPLFKEAVEELFAMGLIKVVFATETLSLGINMPARSVVIESLSKWTGDMHRPLTPGEYRQLTGRAGRRGIDRVGYAVVLYQDYFSPEHVKSLVTRRPSPVVSSFQVTYNMAVNLLATRGIEEAERLVNLSFAQYEADRKVVSMQAKLESLEEELQRDLAASRCSEGVDAGEYRELEKRLSRLSRKLAKITKDRLRLEVRETLSRSRPGDVLVLDGPGRVVAVVRTQASKRRGEPGALVVDAMGRYRRLSARSLQSPPSVVGRVDVDRITSPNRRVRRSVGGAMESMGRGVPAAAENDRTVEEESLASEISAVRERLDDHPCHRCRHRGRCLEAARRADRVKRTIRATRQERDSGHEVVSKRLRDVVAVLGEFGFMEGERLTPRGSILRRVYNECDLLLVEALQERILSPLDPRELATLASWFIYESREGDEEGDRLSREEAEHLEGRLGDVLERLDVIHAGFKAVEARKGLDLLGSLDTGFGDAAFLWAGGAGLDSMLERFPSRSVGDMVRTMKQVVDLLRQIAEVSGEPELRANLEEAMRLVDRGIVGYSSIESIIEHAGTG